MKVLAGFAMVVAVCLVWTRIPVSHAADGRNINAVNTSVRAADGQTYGSLSTVNGDVRVGRGAVADEARTVNGSITLEDDARVGEVGTVNGSVTLAEGVAVEREAHTVNGDVDMARRSRVGGDVATVSGDIDLVGAEVGGELRTHNGDIALRDGARVRGGIHVKETKRSGWNWGRNDPVKVHICSTCVVEGDLRFERPVELTVDNGAKIGNVVGDDVVRK
jgi:cytoskeletal protein CcmA (bactofilin family)